MPAPIGDDRRHAIRQAIEARDGRSRAQLARDYGVSPRTVQRIADQLGLVNPWDTTGTRKATEAAADRRRALRSQLADDLLTVDIPRLRERMAAADTWRKRVALPTGEGPEVIAMAEDDAVIAKGLQTLMTAVGIAVDKTVAIDKHDTQDEQGFAAVDQWLKAMLGGQ